MNNRCLVRRYERRAEHFRAFADLACILLCYRRWAKVTNETVPNLRVMVSRRRAAARRSLGRAALGSRP
jgi:hypothetical protein